MSPKVSVIVPTHNRLPLLPRAVQSVVAQTMPDWELIVVDDGSTDGTAEWLKKQAKVRVLKSENRGVSHARNLGIQNARAPWIAFLDSDDEWLPHKLEKQFQLSTQFQLIHGEEIWIRRGVRVNAMKKHAKSGGRIFSRCVDLCCISPSTAMVSKNALEKYGLFREDFPVCEDYELWLRLCARLEVGFVPQPVTIKYGGHDDQLSTRFSAMDYYRGKALLPFLHNREDLSDDERSYVAQNLAHRCHVLLRGYEKHQNLTKQTEVHLWRTKAITRLLEISPS